MRKNRNLLFLLSLMVLSSFVGCNNGGTVPDPNPVDSTLVEAPVLTQKVNKFIYDAMSDVYLWYDKMPDIDYKYENDSKVYFDKLLYTDDKWSFITDDVQALENSFQGIEKTYGWSLAFGEFSNSPGNYFAVVEYVYPNTPAAAAGIQRGDIILLINSGNITDQNYKELLYGDNLTFTLGALHSDGIADSIDVNLTAQELNLNPVVKTSVVDYEGKKIGYIFYAQYISNYNTALDSTFQSFADQGVTDVVLDLRYNPGGTISAAQHLCSELAPATQVNNESTLVTYQWNDKYQAYFNSTTNKDNIQINFDKSVPVNLNLDHIHILTGHGTASASELTITGLNPYMLVTTVGDTTYGKYTASITVKPEDLYATSYAEEINNWGLQPIVLRYANAWGVTDFKDGFAPTINARDDLLHAYPLGDVNDPLFAAAIEDITGTPVVSAIKSARVSHPEYQIIDRGFSKFDANKRELLIDTEKTIFKK